MVRRINSDEFREREEHILDTAYRILKKQGYCCLTMDGLAGKFSFSKGTLYNHFQSREDVMLALICRFVRVCHDLISRASLFPGSSRERFFAICVAADIDARLNESGLEFMANETLLERASAARREQFLRLHNDIFNTFIGLVRDAIAQGDLPTETEPELVTNSAWSLYVGAQELHDRKFVYPDSQRDDFEQKRVKMIHALLDGYGWNPLSKEMNYPALREKILQSVFPKEAKQLKLIEVAS